MKNKHKNITSITIDNLIKPKKYPFTLPQRSIKIFNAKDYQWVKEAKTVIEKLESIVNSPRTHLSANQEFRKIEVAEKIDNASLRETIKRAKQWRKKDGELLPEQILTNEFETDFAIYENRFILTLIKDLDIFINNETRDLYNQVYSVSSNYQFRSANITAAKGLVSQSNVQLPLYGVSPSLKRKSFLRTDETEFIGVLEQLLIIKRRLTHIMSSRFYQNVNKAKSLKENDIHPTNILMGDHLYAPCYTFYLKLIKIQANKKLINVINNKLYTNYVICSLFKNLKKLKYTFNKKRIKVNNNCIQLTNFRAENKYFKLIISNRNAHIDLKFELCLKNKTFKKSDDLLLRKTNRVSLDAISNIDNLSDEMIDRVITYRMEKGYNNAYIVSSQLFTTNENVIYCSAYFNKVDSNLYNMLNSISLVTEANQFIYSNLCPVCGNPVSIEENKGNYTCPMCNSLYSIIPTKTKLAKFNLLWVKRVKSN